VEEVSSGFDGYEARKPQVSIIPRKFHEWEEIPNVIQGGHMVGLRGAGAIFFFHDNDVVSRRLGMLPKALARQGHHGVSQRGESNYKGDIDTSRKILAQSLLCAYGEGAIDFWIEKGLIRSEID